MSLSLYFQRMTSNVSLCMALPFRPINDLECLVSRVLGSILIAVALLSIPFNVRYLLWSIHHGRHRSRQNLFIFSMIFSSMSVILVVLPSVFLQSFTCRRLCSPFYCQLEGFISYLNGCVHMLLLMMTSIIRYVTVLHATTTKRRFRRNWNLAVLACWMLGLVFAVPPLFKWNRLVPEGLGFHCGLNWFDQSISSHIYLFSTMLFVYFIPLSVLSILNAYVYYIIRRWLISLWRNTAHLLTSLSVVPPRTRFGWKVCRTLNLRWATHAWQLLEASIPVKCVTCCVSIVWRQIDASPWPQSFSWPSIFSAGHLMLAWPYSISSRWHLSLNNPCWSPSVHSSLKCRWWSIRSSMFWRSKRNNCESSSSADVVPVSIVEWDEVVLRDVDSIYFLSRTQVELNKAPHRWLNKFVHMIRPVTIHLNTTALDQMDVANDP